MNLLVSFRTMLLILLIVCAVAVNVTKNLLRAVIIFMSYSSIMCIIWILLESPDLAITEAAVGAGISGVLFLMTLKRIRAEDAGENAGELSRSHGLAQAEEDASVQAREEGTKPEAGREEGRTI